MTKLITKHDKSGIYKKKDEPKIHDIMAKLLKVPQQDILKSINLFSNINTDLKNCFSRLSEIKEDDYVSALMLLDYCLISSKEEVEGLVND